MLIMKLRESHFMSLGLSITNQVVERGANQRKLKQELLQIGRKFRITFIGNVGSFDTDTIYTIIYPNIYILPNNVHSPSEAARLP